MSDITKVREWIDSGEPEPEGGYEWPHPPKFIESNVTGELRSLILKQIGQEDDGRPVRIIESEVEGGYSEYTVETDYGVEVWVRAWHTEFGYSPDSARRSFMQWISK